MSTLVSFGLVFLLSLIILPEGGNTTAVRKVNVDVGDHCALGAAPVGPGGSWQIVEKDVEKICAKGTSCRQGACNCDDLADGTVMGISLDKSGPGGNRVCRRIAGQKCSGNNDCFLDVQCVKGVCTCDKTKKDFICVDKKRDVIIMS